jgi:hypothetical protein
LAAQAESRQERKVEAQTMTVTKNKQRKRARKIGKAIESIRIKLAGDLKGNADEATRQKDAEYKAQVTKQAVEFEGDFQEFLELFRGIQSFNLEWRRAVFCGAVPFDQETDSDLRLSFSSWCLTVGRMREIARDYEPHFGDLKVLLSVSEEFEKEAKETFLNWKSPERSSSPALRTLAVSPDNLEKFKAMFAEGLSGHGHQKSD